MMLAIATLSETVTIVQEAPVIEAARSQITSTVSEEEVAALPMNGRNFLDIALLAPASHPRTSPVRNCFLKPPPCPA